MSGTVSNRWVSWLVVLPMIAIAGGCATYRVGARSLYGPDVTTVYVPIFESDSFRPDLAERLTEAVVKEIELSTPYKVVGTSDADSVLSGRITSDSKRVVVEDFYDAPRELDMNLQVNVSWMNRRREPIREPQVFDWPSDSLEMGQSARLIPEAGQSVAVSQQQAIQRLAKQIVAAMEEPW